MKRWSIILALIFVLGIFSGCKNTDTAKEPPKVEQPNTQEPVESEPQNNKNTNIGGFHLEQPADEVGRKLGKADSVKSVEEGYYGEPYDIWEYNKDNGGYMTFIIGKNTNKVLDLIIAVPEYETDLNIKVGDSYEDVTKQYGSYKNVTSKQDGTELKGWYDLNNGMIIIFDFNRDDQSSINQEIKPDSRVQTIRLSRIEYFD